MAYWVINQKKNKTETKTTVFAQKTYIPNKN